MGQENACLLISLPQSSHGTRFITHSSKFGVVHALVDSRLESGCHPCQRFADNIRKAPVASKRRGWASGGVSSAISGSRAGGMYRNYNCPFRFCVKRFGRVLGPLSSGSAALGALFLGRGQPVDDKGGPAGRKRGFSIHRVGG